MGESCPEEGPTTLETKPFNSTVAKTHPSSYSSVNFVFLVFLLILAYSAELFCLVVLVTLIWGSLLAVSILLFNNQI